MKSSRTGKIINNDKSQNNDCLCCMYWEESGIDWKGTRRDFLGLTGKGPEGTSEGDGNHLYLYLGSSYTNVYTFVKTLHTKC